MENVHETVARIAAGEDTRGALRDELRGLGYSEQEIARRVQKASESRLIDPRREPLTRTSDSPGFVH